MRQATAHRLQRARTTQRSACRRAPGDGAPDGVLTAKSADDVPGGEGVAGSGGVDHIRDAVDGDKGDVVALTDVHRVTAALDDEHRPCREADPQLVEEHRLFGVREHHDGGEVDEDDLVRVARIGKPHGIRGEVTVQVFTDDPDARFAPGERLVVRDGAPGLPAELTVTRARWNKQILVVGFAESLDRNVAETLRGAQLFAVPAAPEESDEWYEEDLVDLEVRVGGERVGVVTALTTGAVQDLLHVALDGVEEEALVPFVEEIVPEIDSEAGVLVLTPPPGLLELATGEDEDAADGPAAARPADADPED